ncbi:hypothetical protein HBI39_116540 [Parastagonospora nodorum]|nr:hypothetical protein HBI12_075530 [Parastagonospora nodorum]KAH5395516.1 hypothetical protein HBI47_230680 [Parastagonospora nodorum]KAH6302799.1 hypothetical protein HBI39_116540 [Parastagonospora nodorum]
MLSLLFVGFRLLCLLPQVFGQDAPLFVQGGFEDATAVDDTYNSGGTITVNGFNIQVPKNLQVQFPAAWVPWKDFTAEKASMLGYEINVIGNFINGKPIAAQVIAYEFFEGLSSGFIESLNFEEGSIKIASGPTIRISDPNAVFSVGNNVAPFFTADDESPSISSFSGFPMCIPRSASDPLCPATNRPFQGSGTFSVPDPLVMAPFLAGDFITFSGIRRGNEVIAFSIVAQNVMITTLGDLVYVRMELGLLGIDNVSPNTEVAESRFVGFASNPRTTVALYAMDIDPCTGKVTDRIIAAMGLRGGRNEQNKFEYRSDILSGYAREYRVVAEINGIPKTRTTKNGLLAGTYVQPINVWVHAEQNIPGTFPPANDFSQMPWLTQGVGVDEAGNLWGPLEPFPQTGVFIEAPQCGVVTAASFQGDELNTTWTGAAQLLNGTATNATEAATPVVVVETPTVSPSAVQKRGIPNGRWFARARADAETPPDGNAVFAPAT